MEMGRAAVSCFRLAVCSLFCLGLPLLLGGCGGAIALMAYLSSAGGGGGGGGRPPELTILEVSAPETPDRIEVRFRIEDDDGGALFARIAYEVVDLTGQPLSPAAPATPVPGSDPTEGISSGEDRRFIWDAGQDLGGDSARSVLVLTPIEGRREGRPVRAQPIRAGNTPVEVRNVRLASRLDRIEVIFDLADEESDRIHLKEVQLQVGGEDWLEVPLSAIDRKDFPSSPGGERATFGFLATRLEHPELSQPGFVGEIGIGFVLEDFPGDAVAAGPASFTLDNNDPPSIQFLQLPSRLLADGVIPIRYRLSDRETNPADIAVDVDLKDGNGFRPANEFPSTPSSGRTALETLPLEGQQESFHTFLWDALSQTLGNEAAEFRIRPRDREEGRPQSIFPELARAPFHLAATFPACSDPKERPQELLKGHGLVAADFDRDGFEDCLVTGGAFCGEVTYLRGSPRGLQLVRYITLGPGSSPLPEIGDFNRDGFPDALVPHPISGKVFILEGGEGGLGDMRVREFQAGNVPLKAVTGDFDGNGFLDAVVANLSSNFITLLIGGENGVTESRAITVHEGPFVLSAGDFNGDGLDDLAVGHAKGPVISYLEGNRMHSLEPRGEILGRTATLALTAGDFDRDGILDLAIGAASKPVSVLIVPGNKMTGLLGGAIKEIPIPGALFDVNKGLVARDLNGDGFLDLVFVGFSSNSIFYLEGGDDGFDTLRVTEIPVGVEPAGFTIADFDRDGFLDLCVANRESNSLSFLKGTPDGPRPVQAVPGGEHPVHIASGDFDGNGVLEIAVATYSDFITVLRPDQGGPSRSGVEIPLGKRPLDLVSGDFNGDGKDDLISSSGYLNQLAGKGTLILIEGKSGTLAPTAEILDAGDPLALLSGDFNGDGFSDLVSAEFGGEEILYLAGSQAFPSAPLRMKVGRYPRALLGADCDGDGLLDLLVANFGSASVSFLHGDRQEGLKSMDGMEIPIGEQPIALAAGNFDGDGFLDVAVACWGSGGIVVLPGSGDGLKPGGKSIRTGRFPSALLSGDFDRDGYSDLVVANWGSHTIVHLQGSPVGLRKRGDFALGPAASPVALAGADFDGNGFPDVAAANFGSDSVAWFLGGPSGLRPGGALPVGEEPMAIVSADFDGDGFPDIATTNQAAKTTSYLRGGPGGLAWGFEIEVGAGPRSLSSADLDGDGFPDLAVANSSDNRITFHRGRFLSHHASALVDPEKIAEVLVLDDPRHPCRYRLDLPPAVLGSPDQVCLIPAPVFELPVIGQETCLHPVTDAVTILRETTTLKGTASLTLRIRDANLEEVRSDPAALRVFTKHRGESGRGIVAELEGAQIQLVPIEDGLDAIFSITRFGTYLIAIERER